MKTIKQIRSVAVFAGVVVCAGLLGACEERTSSVPPARTSDMPGNQSQTQLGKTRDMAKELGARIGNQQAQAEDLSNQISGGTGGEGTLTVAQVSFKLPKTWQRTNPSGTMRAGELKVPGAGGGEEATVWFTTFGAGQGGDVESNINRWSRQVTGPDGQPAKFTRNEKTVGAIKVITIASSGTFAMMSGGMMGGAAPAAAPKADQRVLRAIVEGPSGTIFVSMAGDVKTVEAAEGAWETMLGSVSGEK